MGVCACVYVCMCVCPCVCAWVWVCLSTGAFLSSENDPTGALAWVEERIAAAAQIPVSHGEPFNLLRYQNMQHYDAHLDAFDPKVCMRVYIYMCVCALML